MYLHYISFKHDTYRFYRKFCLDQIFCFLLETNVHPFAHPERKKSNTYLKTFMKKPAISSQEGSGKQKRLEETEETVTVASLLYLAP